MINYLIMKRNFIIAFFLILIPCNIIAAEFVYILNDKCIEDLFQNASTFFFNTGISTVKDSRGIILRYFFEDPIVEYYRPNIKKYRLIEDFLVKIENPAIIEVHINNFPSRNFANLKKWEFSTIMSNYIEDIITKPKGNIEQERINSIGYGEFLPAKNTSNNGGKILNRIDIIILCNISGE